MADEAILSIKIEDKGAPAPAAGPPRAPGGTPAGAAPAPPAAVPPRPLPSPGPAADPLAVRIVQAQPPDWLKTAGALGQIAGGLPGGGLLRAGVSGASMGQAAGGGLGSILGGAAGGAVGGPIGMAIGAAVAIAGEIKKKIEEAMQQFFKMGAAIVSFDAQALSRGFADLATQVPIVGGLMGGLAHGMLDLLDATENTARRLANFNPALAMQVAQFDIQNTLRDMQRAQTLGPELMRAMQVRQDFRVKLEEFMDRIAPMLLKLVEFAGKMLPLVEDGFEAGILAWNGILEAQALMVQVFDRDTAAAIRELQIIARNTEPPFDPAAAGENLLALLRTLTPDMTRFKDALQGGQRVGQLPAHRGPGGLPAFGF